MCNDYRLEVDVASILEDFDDLQIKIGMPEGAPNVPAREDVRITDMAPIVKAADGDIAGELVNRRWSWPGQGGKPVYNVRSEGRDLGTQRCLVLCDGFYEFTDPADTTQKRLDKWLFTMKDHRSFCMAGTANETGRQIVERELGVPPTIRIHEGARVRVLVTRDIIFEPVAAERAR